jgi:ribose-phosphate pyrophosphokinase
MIKYSFNGFTTNVAVSKFPGGEVKVDINNISPVNFDAQLVVVKVSLKTSDDVIALLLTVDALRRQFPNAKLSLRMPYIPYARQDRVCNDGEAFSMRVFAGLINSCNFSEVVTIDAHSDVAPALINNCVNLPQSVIFRQTVEDFSDYFVVAPDAGAYKKAHKLAQSIRARGVICANKVRDVRTGQILETIVDADVTMRKLLVADDLCDGGKTFVELGKTLRDGFCDTLKLVVTHGLFTKGTEVLTDHYDFIYTTNSYHNEAVGNTDQNGVANLKVRWINVI